MSKERRALLVVGAGAALVAVVGCSGGDGSPSDGKSASSAAPSPTRSYPLSKASPTIPAVHDFTPAHGPGWKPGDGKVVVEDGELADEGRLLAKELGLDYAGTGDDAGAGDVELAIGGKKGANPESYRMTVKAGTVRIVGPGDAGVFYGTRTLKQQVHDGARAPEGVTADEPAKPQRGFNLDIARKHFTADWIKDRIRDIGDLKYNQLGLHFSDDQSFRIASDSHPEVVSKDHLSKAQVRDILKLAAERHITVVPEIDSPGHLGAVIAAHPDLQLRDVNGQPTRGAVDISKPGSAKIVDDLLKEYAKLFKGAYWHLGADEYQALMKEDPEASYPQLVTAARKRYGANAKVQDLAQGWLNDRAKTMAPYDRKLKAWNDGFYDGGVVDADKGIEVAYWTGKEIGAREPLEYLEGGRKLTNYNDEYLYYVLGQPNEFVYPTGERIYKSWTPRVVRGTSPVPAKYDDQILGGSFAVWCDIAGAQTPEQVAKGIRMPLRATSQKLWDAGEPELSWTRFTDLADKLDGSDG